MYEVQNKKMANDRLTGYIGALDQCIGSFERWNLSDKMKDPIF